MKFVFLTLRAKEKVDPLVVCSFLMGLFNPAQGKTEVSYMPVLVKFDEGGNESTRKRYV